MNISSAWRNANVPKSRLPCSIWRASCGALEPRARATASDDHESSATRLTIAFMTCNAEASEPGCQFDGPGSVQSAADVSYDRRTDFEFVKTATNSIAPRMSGLRKPFARFRQRRPVPAGAPRILPPRAGVRGRSLGYPRRAPLFRISSARCSIAAITCSPRQHLQAAKCSNRNWNGRETLELVHERLRTMHVLEGFGGQPLDQLAGVRSTVSPSAARSFAAVFDSVFGRVNQAE